MRSFDRAQVTWRGLFGFGFITLITAYTNYLLRYLVISRHDVTRSSIAVTASFLITVILADIHLEPLPFWKILRIPAGAKMVLAGACEEGEGTHWRLREATFPVRYVPSTFRPPGP